MEPVVVLTVPAEPRHAATARVVAAALAADEGFDTDAIDDLRLAVNEAVALLTDLGDASDGPVTDDATITLTFHVHQGRIEVDLVHSAPPNPPEVDELAATILGAVVDAHDVHATGLRLTKSAPVG